MRTWVGALTVTSVGCALAACWLSPIDTCKDINRPDAPLTLRMLNETMEQCGVSTSGPGCTDVVCRSPRANGGCACWQGRVRGPERGEQCTVSLSCLEKTKKVQLTIERSCGPSAMDVSFEAPDQVDERYFREDIQKDGGSCE
jgi:hypothetical protein